jgi:hypothetical protein
MQFLLLNQPQTQKKSTRMQKKIAHRNSKADNHYDRLIKSV